MYKHWTQDVDEVRARLWAPRLRLPQVDAMDRATWLLAAGGVLAVFVGWG